MLKIKSPSRSDLQAHFFPPAFPLLLISLPWINPPVYNMFVFNLPLLYKYFDTGIVICVTSQENLFEKRSEEHTSELQSRFELVCRLLLEKKKKNACKKNKRTTRYAKT